MLFLAALIWGTAFVSQSVGMDYMGPFTFNGVRSLLGSVVLLPALLVIYLTGKKKSDAQNVIFDKQTVKTTVLGGAVCGLLLMLASTMQQIGIMYTSVGKAGFITALYIIIVPILGIFLKKRVSVMVWIGAFVAAAGMYLLCVSETTSINKGDVFVFICAILFSLHILAVDYFAPKTNGVVLSCIQFFVCGVICTTLAFIFENPQWSQLQAGMVPILYAGVMSCGVAYTFQILGQKNADPTISSLILSLESAVSVLAGWWILDQQLSVREIIGCVLVFAAVIMVQLVEGKKDVKANA